MQNALDTDILRRTWVEIDLDALENNYKNIQAFCGGKRIMAVIKADAYGHGAEKTAELFESMGVYYLAVSNLEEALQLRNSGIKSRILILGYTPPVFTNTLIENGFTQTVFDGDSAAEYAEAALKTGENLTIHIKVDTGMSRLGFACNETSDPVEDIKKVCSMEGLTPKGIFTHFAAADEPGNPYTQLQLERFKKLLETLEGQGYSSLLKHAANSGACLNYPETRLDIIRPGLILYGIYPAGERRYDITLVPAMKLISTVSQVRSIRKGTPVGYDCAFVADRDMRVAVVPIGYADGFLRRESKGGWFLIEGKKAPIVGNICMDMCMADVTDIDVSQGSKVIVFGNGEEGEMTLNEAAKIAGTIPYELCCLVSKRVTRLYYQGGKQVGRRSYIV